MAKVIRIGTNGYCGPSTGFAFLPPGEYEVGGEQVSEALANYLLEIGLAWAVEYAEEAPKAASRAHRANKIVDITSEE